MHIAVLFNPSYGSITISFKGFQSFILGNLTRFIEIFILFFAQCIISMNSFIGQFKLSEKRDLVRLYLSVLNETFINYLCVRLLLGVQSIPIAATIELLRDFGRALAVEQESLPV